MRKQFSLNIEGKQRERVLDAVKHDINRYLKRERRRQLPQGADYWDFDCKFGLDKQQAEPIHLATLTAHMDKACAEAASQFYIELVSKPGRRKITVPGASLATPD